MTKAAHGLVPQWCLPRDAFLKINAIVPRAYYQRMRVYFEFYGCLVCHKKTRTYYSCGMCQRCSVRVRDRLARCARVLAKRQSEAIEPIPTGIETKIRSARLLLADLRVSRATATSRGVGACAVPQVITLRLEDEKRGASRVGAK